MQNPLDLFGLVIRKLTRAWARFKDRRFAARQKRKTARRGVGYRR